MRIVIVAAVALVGCEMAERTCSVGHVCETPAERLGVGSAPGELALRDVDGDGTLDLVAISPPLGTLTVAWGWSGAVETWSVGQLPEALAFGDVDGDSRLDVVVALAGEAALAVLRGAGPRRLAGPERVAVGRRPTAVTTADLDGDGRAEIVVVDGVDDDLRVVAYGPQGLVAGPAIAVGAGPAGVVAGDFSGDGVADVAVTLEVEGVARLFLGTGAGGLRAGPELYAGAGPTRALAADLDDDGALDLALVDALVDEAAVVFGDGAGGVRETLRWPVPAGPRDLSMRTGSEGHELIILSEIQAGITRIPLAAPERRTTTPGRNWAALATGDVDGDGAAEVVAGGQVATAVLRDGPGFGFVPWFERRGPGLSGPLVAHDVDGDGWLDVVMYDPEGQEIVTLRGEEGGFSGPLRSPGPDRVDGLVTADVDGDGTVDVVTWQRPVQMADEAVMPGRVWSARGVAAQFAAATTFVLPGDPLRVLAFDEDGDGRSELMAMQGRYALPVAEVPVDGGPGLLTLQLVGEGLSLVRKSMAPQFALGGALIMGEFSADHAGDEQIRLEPTPAGWEIVAESHSAGAVWRSPGLLPLVDLQGLTRGDVNGDEIADLLLCSENGLIMVAGRSWRSFAPGVLLGGGRCSGLTLAELNGDGQVDVLAIEGQGVEARLAHNLRWLPNFIAGGTTTASNLPQALVVADFDRDGLPDLAASGAGGLEVRRGAPLTVLRALEDEFEEKTPIGRPGGLQLGDLDGDGDDEVVALGLGGEIGVGYFGILNDNRWGLGPVRYAVPDGALRGDDEHRLVLDMDGDGVDELLWGASVWRWSEGAFVAGETLAIPIERSGSMQAGDLDGDGDDDVVYVDLDDSLTSHLGGPEGLGVGRAGPRLAAGTAGLRLADVDRDGRLDAIVTRWSEGPVVVHLGDGGGGFVAAPQQWPLDGRASVVVAGDVDGDGFGDLVASGFNKGAGNIRVCHGGEDGPRGDCEGLYVGPEEAGVIALAAEDVDGDGVTDLLAVVTDEATRWLVFGRGGGGQWAISEKPLPPGPTRHGLFLNGGTLRKARLDAEGPEWVFLGDFALTRLGLRVP